ncbi:MAG: copper resistance protein NlpE N-terminal domain-containing protein [Arenimonas sp.]
MSPRTLLLTCLLLLTLSACKPEAGTAAGAPQSGATGGTDAVAAQDTERSWAGLLPCRDCQGVDTRLVLRTKLGRRAYVMTETYLGGSGKNSFDRTGTWTEVQGIVDGEPQVTYVLDPDRAAQRFELQPDGALELLDADGRPPEQAVAYRLQRL